MLRGSMDHRRLCRGGRSRRWGRGRGRIVGGLTHIQRPRGVGKRLIWCEGRQSLRELLTHLCDTVGVLLGRRSFRNGAGSCKGQTEFGVNRNFQLREADGITILWNHLRLSSVTYSSGPPLLTWISNCIHYKAWDEITYPFPNFNSATVEVWEWISNFIPHFTGHVITYPCWD